MYICFVYNYSQLTMSAKSIQTCNNVEKDIFLQKKEKIICIYQKKVVSLHSK